MTRLPSNSKRSPVCCCLVAKSCLTLCNPWAAACQAPLSFTISQRLLSLMSIEPVMLSNHLISSVVPFSLSSVFPRVLKAPSIRAFSNESSHCIRWPKYWSFSISPSSEYSGLISFRVDCLWSPCSPRDSQESSLAPGLKRSLLQRSAFFMVQTSCLYMTTGKTTALTIRTYVSDLVSLLFNMLSRLVIAFLPKSKRFLISWLKSQSAVILVAC